MADFDALWDGDWSFSENVAKFNLLFERSDRGSIHQRKKTGRFKSMISARGAAVAPSSGSLAARLASGELDAVAHKRELVKELVRGASAEQAACAAAVAGKAGKYRATKARTDMAGFKSFETDIPDHFPGGERVLSEVMSLPAAPAPDGVAAFAASVFDVQAPKLGMSFTAATAAKELGLYEDRPVLATFGVLRAPYARLGAAVLRLEFTPAGNPAAAIVAVVSVNHPGLSTKGLRVMDVTMMGLMATASSPTEATLLILRQVKLPKVGCLPVSTIKNKVRTVGHKKIKRLYALMTGA